jgi:hypothetical protein
MLPIRGPLLAVVLLCFCLHLDAQEKETSNKKHFEIVGNLSQDDQLKVQEALDNYGLLDAYRLDAQRRTVVLEGLKASVVLYSNQELQKPIGNNKRKALKSAPKATEMRFAITPKGKLKVISEQ